MCKSGCSIPCRFTKYRHRSGNGTHWGQKPTGILTYTDRGFVSANMAATEPELRPSNVTWPPKPEDAQDLWALIGRHALSYAGTFTITERSPDEKTGQVIHGPLTVCSVPALVGTNLTRNYTLLQRPDGEYLRLFSVNTESGRSSEIWWKRLA